MKSFIAIAAIALTVSLCSARAVRSGNDLQDLVDAALAYQAADLKPQDPLKLDDVRPTPIVMPNVRGIFSASNITFTGQANTAVDTELVNPDSLNAQVIIRYPSVVETYKYTAEGVYKQHKFQGSGDVRFEVQNVTTTINVTLLNINIPFVNKTFVQIKSLDISNNLGPLSVDITGLTSEGETVAQIEEDIKKVIIDAFNHGKALRERIASLSIQADLNLHLAGKSIEDATNWLKEHTNSQEYSLTNLLHWTFHFKEDTNVQEPILTNLLHWTFHF